MFYSHEILTDRKHGVATIWLVATLGSKSSLKKITRKAILDVDVPNACETITDLSAPLALRTQSNLLFGVSKVFSQQCAYMLSDMQNLKDKMRGVTMLLRELEIDPSVASTRPEQLNLPADPGFNLDLDLGFDLSSFDISFSTTESSSLMSPRTLPSSQTSYVEDENVLRISLSPSSLTRQDMDYGFGLNEGGIDSAERYQQSSRSANDIQFDDDAVIAEDEVFHIEEDGNLVIRNQSAVLSSGKIDRAADIPDRISVHDLDLGLNTDDQEYADQQHITSYLGGEQEAIGHSDIDEEDASARRDPSYDSSVLPPSQPHDQLHQSIENSEDNRPEIATQTITGAAYQRTKQAKTVPFDDPAQVMNSEINHWRGNYRNLMELAHQQKADKISMAQAKRNAAYWILDQGVGGVSADFRDDQEQHPLAVFSGQALLDMLSGSGTSKSSRKRSASAVTESEKSDDGRRVRLRSDDQQHGGDRDDGQEDAVDDQDIDFGDEIEPEAGRQEQAPMPDHPDSMPWNIYASSRQGSRAGSAHPTMSAAVASSSIGRLASIDCFPSSRGSKRISRLLQESPLEQRHRLLRQGSFSSVEHRGQDSNDLNNIEGDGFGLEIDDDELDRQLAGNLGEASDFELYGPAAAVSTQEATNSQWLAATLEQESFNFLTFLQTTLEGKQADMEDEDVGATVTVTFDELLPPEDNNEVVAAQGLLHVLALATKGLVHVNQEEDFGDIHLGVVPDHEDEEPEDEAES